MSIVSTIIIVALAVFLIIQMKDIVASAITIAVVLAVCCGVYYFIPETRGVLSPIYSFTMTIIGWIINFVSSFIPT